MSEGQEDEMEEMEEEIDEGELGDEAADAGKDEDGNQNSQKVDPESKILDATNADKAQASSVVPEDGANASSATPAAPDQQAS